MFLDELAVYLSGWEKMPNTGRGARAGKVSILQRDAMLIGGVVYRHKDDNPVCGISHALHFCSSSDQKCLSFIALCNIITR